MIELQVPLAAPEIIEDTNDDRVRVTSRNADVTDAECSRREQMLRYARLTKRVLTKTARRVGKW